MRMNRWQIPTRSLSLDRVARSLKGKPRLVREHNGILADGKAKVSTRKVVPPDEILPWFLDVDGTFHEWETAGQASEMHCSAFLKHEEDGTSTKVFRAAHDYHIELTPIEALFSYVWAFDRNT